jgi:hypothetical protein
MFLLAPDAAMRRAHAAHLLFFCVYDSDAFIYIYIIQLKYTCV